MDDLKGKLENLAKQGVFGAGSFLRVLSASDSRKGVQFQSELAFFEVNLVPATGKITKVPVVVKTQLKDETVREGTGQQFFNEVTMYKTVLPELGVNNLDIIPKMYHGYACNGENPEEDIVVLEDLRPENFKISDNQFFDFDHVELAMKKLGQLHGLSYRMKASCPEKLVELRNKLIPKMLKDSEGVHEACLARGFKPLVDSSPIYSVVNKVYKKMVGMSALEFLSSLQKAEEPFAVITHGDFNRNNILFKYDDRGKVVDLKMVDYGYSDYLDPVVDIAFFLYMNTSPETRTQHWDTFLNVYWGGVTSVAGDPGFSYREFHRHFAERAIYGYLPCCYFLPMMLVGNIAREILDNMNAEEKAEYFSTLGGKECTDATSAIVQHLLTEGYLDAYLRNFDNTETIKESLTPGYTNVTFNFA